MHHERILVCVCRANLNPTRPRPMRNRIEFRDANASEKAISRRVRVGERSRIARETN